MLSSAKMGAYISTLFQLTKANGKSKGQGKEIAGTFLKMPGLRLQRRRDVVLHF